MERREQFRQALATLEQAFLSVPTDLEIDGAIHRFENCFELAWRLLKGRLELDGNSNVASPRSALRQGILSGYIENEEAWLRLLDDRNTSVYIDDATGSREIFARLPAHHDAMLALLNKLDTA